MSGSSSARRVVAELALVLVGFAAVGAVAGVVWERIWSPTVGVAVDHQWTAGDAIGLQHEFSGTGWYVVVASVAGILTGVVVALLAHRMPLLTLAAVVVGSVLAAWLMLVVGTALGPPDHEVVAATAADGTRIPMALSVTGRSAFTSLPAGALIGLMVVFIGLAPRRHPEASAAPVETLSTTSADSPAGTSPAG
jgi:hypothetical protein